MDHRPKTYSLSSSPNHHSPRQNWHLDFMPPFTLNIRHIQGSNNQAADPLSQVQTVSQNSSLVIDFEQMAIAQRDDPELSKLRSSSNSFDLRNISLPFSGNLLTCNTSTGILKACPHLSWIQSTLISHFNPLRTKLDQSTWIASALQT